MTLSRLAGAVLAVLAAWSLWQGIHAVDVIVSRGSGLSDALLQPPTSLIRILAAALLLLGAILAMAGRRLGAWIAVAGWTLFALLTALMMASSPAVKLWGDELVLTALFAVLCVVEIIAVRKSH